MRINKNFASFYPHLRLIIRSLLNNMASADKNVKLLHLLHQIVLFAYGALYDHDVWWSKNRVHYGYDVVSNYEDDIVLHDGVAIVGNDKTGWGLYLKVRHAEGWETIYAHLSEVYVKTGDKVKAGDICYRTGESGSAANNPHLHLEVRVYGVKYSDTGPKSQQDPNRYWVAVNPSPIHPPITTNPPASEEGESNFELVSSLWKVVSEWVYIRSGPGTNYGDVGILNKGDTVIGTEGIEAFPGSRWIKHDKGYTAFYNNGTIYLEPIKNV